MGVETVDCTRLPDGLPDSVVDWRGRDLAGNDLRGRDLRRYNLSGANLSGANLSGARLSGARLTGARLRGANLSDCDLEHANLDGVDATEANFDRSVASFSSAEAMVAPRASFRGAEWYGATLDRAELDSSRWSGARLDRASLLGVRLDLARLDRTVLDDSDLDGASMVGARGRGIALLRAKGRFRFDQADFTGADLRGLILADLGFAGAQLDGCRIDERANRGTRVQLSALGWESTWSRRLQRGVITVAVAIFSALFAALRIAGTWIKARFEAWRTEPESTEEDEAESPPETRASPEEAKVDSVVSARPSVEDAVSSTDDETKDEDDDDPTLAYAAFQRARSATNQSLRRELAGRSRLARARTSLSPAAARANWQAAARRGWRAARDIVIDPAESTRTVSPGVNAAFDAFEEHREDRASALAKRGQKRDVAARQQLLRAHQVGQRLSAQGDAQGATPAAVQRVYASVESSFLNQGMPRPRIADAYDFAARAATRSTAGTLTDGARFAKSTLTVVAVRSGVWAVRRTESRHAEARTTQSHAGAAVRFSAAAERIARYQATQTTKATRNEAFRADGRAAARELAEQARRAQQARDAERARKREGIELAELEERFAELEGRKETLSAPQATPAERAEMDAEIARSRAVLDAQRATFEAAKARTVSPPSETAWPTLRAPRPVGIESESTPTAPEPTIEPGAQLAGRVLDGRNFANANLENADLRGASLVGAHFENANLKAARLDECDLTGANLNGAVLDGAVLDGAVIHQVSMRRTSLAGASAKGAELGSVSAEVRSQLIAAGAESTLAGGGSALGYVGIGLGLAASSLLIVYLADRFADERGLNPAALEQKASEARQSGNDAAAAAAFSDLAAQAERADSKIDFLIEAAASAEDADDRTRALELLAQAVLAAKDTPDLPRALLAQANAWRRLDLRAGALTEFRALLARRDLAPDQIAAAIVGLRDSLDDGAVAEAEQAQLKALTACSTDPERGSLAYALADNWTAMGDSAAATTALEAALSLVTDPTVRSQIRLRVAQVRAEGGDIDGALALYRDLAGGAGGENASLGAAELLLRTGRDAEAAALLQPLYKSTDHDVRARALRAKAGLAERAGDAPGALLAVRAILELDGVPANVLDEARIVLARLDPSAVDELVRGNPTLRAELQLGRARALKEAGERTDAREIWVELAEDSTVDAGVRADATLALAELQVEDGDAEGAVRRYDAMLAGLLATDSRERVSLARSNALAKAGKIQEAEAGYLALKAAAGPEIRSQCDLGLAHTAELQGQVSRAADLYALVGRTDGPWAIEALMSLGELREQTGDLPLAAEAYRLARNRPGDSARRAAADVALAEVLTETGDPAASQVYATLLASTDPAVRVAAKLAVGNQRLASAPAEARILFEEALADAVPGEMRTQVRAGWIAAAVGEGQVDEAQSRLGAWFDTESDAAERESLAAGALRSLRAGGAASTAAKLSPTYANAGFEAAIEAALSLREVGQPGEAAAVLRKTVGATAEDERWRKELLAEVLIEANDLDAADDVWKTLSEAESRESARFGRARVARARGNYADALTLLEGSTDPRVPGERALALEGLGRLDEAETLYVRLADEPLLETKSAGVVGLARVRLGRDDAAGALSALARLPTIDAGYALTAAQLRGDALLALGRVSEARDVYRGLDQDAEARTIRSLGLGECALAGEDANGAIRLFQKAFSETEDDFYKALALAGVARALAESGDLAQAKLELQRLRKDYPERTDAISLAAMAIEK